MEAVAFREGEGLVCWLPRPQHQLLDVRGALEVGEVGVGVELGVECHVRCHIDTVQIHSNIAGRPFHVAKGANMSTVIVVIQSIGAFLLVSTLLALILQGVTLPSLVQKVFKFLKVDIQKVFDLFEVEITLKGRPAAVVLGALLAITFFLIGRADLFNVVDTVVLGTKLSSLLLFTYTLAAVGLLAWVAYQVILLILKQEAFDLLKSNVVDVWRSLKTSDRPLKLFGGQVLLNGGAVRFAAIAIIGWASFGIAAGLSALS